jgi:ubiquinone/menaquinone biosynthesis C-methylase UbiE
MGQQQLLGGPEVIDAGLRADQLPNPALVLDTIYGYQRSAALRAAIGLDLFTAIGAGSADASKIAKTCSASERGVRILCDYLTIAGLLSKKDGHYGLTPTSSAFLDRRSPTEMTSTIRFLQSPKLLSAFANLTEAVRRGGTDLPKSGATEAELDDWVTFAESMTPIIRPSAEFISELATADGRRPKRVLDIAAGHGLFGILIAKRAPEAHIVAQDWPNVLRVARQNAESARVSDRYEWLPGDAFTVDFGVDFDAVLVTNFLHHFNKGECERLLQRAYRSLNPGGRLYVLEFVPNSDRITPPIAASFSLMMLGLTPEGDAYTMQELEAMLVNSGFTHSELLQVPKSPQQVIVSTRD